MNESADQWREVIIFPLGDFAFAQSAEQADRAPWLTIVARTRQIVICPSDPARFTQADLVVVEELRRAMQALYDQGFRYLAARGELPGPDSVPPIG
ncbi:MULTISPECIES: hypothetical protein [unclassified Crossiella]|uniref:hypothetical protein n=1 Tax=unclassified Crossiella TaxID=2620835 RepID=UPI001FFEB463|nr:MULTISPECIES: hypothetical protein [unclassified Crossiella]MCK2237422.1 hypothetical protein [Crossiella sp. S99.2]MCK2251077.1 hypothetical protein [Crossiella sp. S99.1]